MSSYDLFIFPNFSQMIFFEKKNKQIPPPQKKNVIYLGRIIP